MTYREQHTCTIPESKETRVDTMAHNVTVLALNIQGHHQAHVVIDPITGASLEYRHIIKGPTK